jgi:hypothetical protein
MCIIYINIDITDINMYHKVQRIESTKASRLNEGQATDVARIPRALICARCIGRVHAVEGPLHAKRRVNVRGRVQAPKVKSPRASLTSGGAYFTYPGPKTKVNLEGQH